MRLQKEVKFFDLALFSPGFCNLLAVLRADPFHLTQSFGLLFDNRQRLFSKVLDDALGLLRPNALDQTRTQVARDSLDRSRQALGETDHVELATILRVF